MGTGGPTPIVIPVHCAPKKAPCPECGKQGRRKRSFPGAAAGRGMTLKEKANFVFKHRNRQSRFGTTSAGASVLMR